MGSSIADVAVSINAATMDCGSERPLVACGTRTSEEWTRDVALALHAGTDRPSIHYSALGLQDEKIDILRGYVQHIVLLSAHLIGDLRAIGDGS
jgi:hypothetical protein